MQRCIRIQHILLQKEHKQKKVYKDKNSYVENAKCLGFWIFIAVVVLLVAVLFNAYPFRLTTNICNQQDDQLAQHKSLITKLYDDNKELNSTNKQLYSDKKQLEARNKLLDNENKQLKKVNNQLNDGNKQLIKANSQLNDENQQLKKTNNQFDDDNKQLKGGLDDNLRRLRMKQSDENDDDVKPSCVHVAPIISKFIALLRK